MDNNIKRETLERFIEWLDSGDFVICGYQGRALYVASSEELARLIIDFTNDVNK